MKRLVGISLMLVASACFAATTTAAPNNANTTPANAAAAATMASTVAAQTPTVELWQQNTSSAGVFMQLDNQSNQRATIVAAYSPVAAETELHDFVTIKGQTVMQQVSEIVIKAKSDDVLKPGGFHVMLMGLKKPLSEGAAVPITLIFADGSDLQVNAHVAS